MRLDLCLAQAAKQLDTDTARLDAELLLLYVLDKSRSFIFSWPEFELNESQLEQFEQLLTRRIAGEPVAHLIGEREFWSLPIQVNASTLIPRPDTEALVEAALALDLPLDAKVVDLGTGTGAIALALASEQPQWQISAVEYQSDAFALAQTNAERLGLKVDIKQGSWFEPLTGQKFHLIVSNPPYIDPEDHHLDQGDVRFEPKTALTAADHGLADLRYIAGHAPQYLVDGGVLMMEHGYDQGEAVQQIFVAAGFSQVTTGLDLSANQRYTMGYRTR